LYKDAVLLKNEELKGINRDKIAVFLLSNCTHEGHETFKDILFCGFGMSCVMTLKQKQTEILLAGQEAGVQVSAEKT
jgi:hypothetical protein